MVWHKRVYGKANLTLTRKGGSDLCGIQSVFTLKLDQLAPRGNLLSHRLERGCNLAQSRSRA